MGIKTLKKQWLAWPKKMTTWTLGSSDHKHHPSIDSQTKGWNRGVRWIWHIWYQMQMMNEVREGQINPWLWWVRKSPYLQVLCPLGPWNIPNRGEMDQLRWKKRCLSRTGFPTQLKCKKVEVGQEKTLWIDIEGKLSARAVAKERRLRRLSLQERR